MARNITLKTDKLPVRKSFGVVEKFNPYHDERGRFSTANAGISFTYRTKDPKKQHWADRAIERETERTKDWDKPKKNYDKHGFADYDDADYHDLYNGKGYFKQQQLDAKQLKACQNYVDPDTEPGSLHSHAQNLNHKMVGDKPLTGKYADTHDGMMSAMHNMGHNVKLTRYDHDGMINSMLKALGVGDNYEDLTDDQLQKALVGRELKENKMISTSYNNFKNTPQATKETFTSRAIRIIYLTKAGTQVVMPGIGAAGDLGEVVLAPTNGKSNKPGKILSVRRTGEKARRQGDPVWLKTQERLEIVVELP